MIEDKVTLHREYRLGEKSKCVVNIEFYDSSFESIGRIEECVKNFFCFAERVLKENRLKDIESIKGFDVT